MGQIFRDNSSEKQFNSTWPLSGQHPPTFQRNKWHSSVWDSSKGLHKCRDFSRCRWSQLCQTSKSNQSWEILKGCCYTCALIYKPSKLLAKGKVMSLAKAFCLSKGNITFNDIQLLPRTLCVSFLYGTDSWMFTLIGLTPASRYTWPIM
jgi:hypothetical protein